MDAADFVAAAERFADLSRDVITAALRRPRHIEVKADASPVTPVDRQVERALRGAIERAFPTHGIFGEEFDPVRLDAEYIWVLDPIDGTKAFMAGLPAFGTLIALTRRRLPVLGVMDSPATRERWVAVDGHGTRLNGVAIRARPCAALSDALACTSSPAYFVGEDFEAHQKMQSAVRWMLYGGGCHAHGCLARGLVDVAFEADCKIFDYLALVPIVTHAGGIITDWAGEPLTMDSGSQFVASGDRRVHADALVRLEARN